MTDHKSGRMLVSKAAPMNPLRVLSRPAAASSGTSTAHIVAGSSLEFDDWGKTCTGKRHKQLGAASSLTDVRDKKFFWRNHVKSGTVKGNDGMVTAGSTIQSGRGIATSGVVPEASTLRLPVPTKMKLKMTSQPFATQIEDVEGNVDEESGQPGRQYNFEKSSDAAGDKATDAKVRRRKLEPFLHSKKKKSMDLKDKPKDANRPKVDKQSKDDTRSKEVKKSQKCRSEPRRFLKLSAKTKPAPPQDPGTPLSVVPVTRKFGMNVKIMRKAMTEARTKWCPTDVDDVGNFHRNEHEFRDAQRRIRKLMMQMALSGQAASSSSTAAPSTKTAPTLQNLTPYAITVKEQTRADAVCLSGKKARYVDGRRT